MSSFLSTAIFQGLLLGIFIIAFNYWGEPEPLTRANEKPSKYKTWVPVYGIIGDSHWKEGFTQRVGSGKTALTKQSRPSTHYIYMYKYNDLWYSGEETVKGGNSAISDFGYVENPEIHKVKSFFEENRPTPSLYTPCKRPNFQSAKALYGAPKNGETYQQYSKRRSTPENYQHTILNALHNIMKCKEYTKVVVFVDPIKPHNSTISRSREGYIFSHNLSPHWKLTKEGL